GEYFFKITSPSRSMKISSGSPSRIRNVLLISFGITTLPKSSIRRTIPVAFIVKPHFLTLFFFVLCQMLVSSLTLHHETQLSFCRFLYQHTLFCLMINDVISLSKYTFLDIGKI